MALVAQAMATPLRTTQAERSGMILLRALEDGGRFGIGGHRVVSSFWQRVLHWRFFLLALWTGEFFVGLSAIFKSQEFLATIHFMDSRRCG
jgi:hypothetical protein